MTDALDPRAPRPRLEEQLARGRALRRTLKRRDHAALELPDRDVIGLLEEQNATRMPEMVPIRVGRMMQSPFAFYRGTAAQMAHDLRDAPRTDVRVVACGDAHLANFGLYASPERRLMFDLNDFDEVDVAPWEWDVKRLGASIVLAGRDIGASEKACAAAVSEAVCAYRGGLEKLFAMTALERFYYRVEADRVEESTRGSAARRLMRTAEKKARKRTSTRVLRSITTEGSGGDLRIVDDPPILRHLGLITPESTLRLMKVYRDTAAPDVVTLLEQFTVVDGAFRAVGVGSVGLRAHIALLVGPSGEPLFLQAKEARPSVLVSQGGMPLGRPEREPQPPAGLGREGWRVVTGQRIMQAVSDRFLGWFAHEGRDYYIRQFRDMKGAIDLESLTAASLTDYAAVCGALLARAHAQSPGAGTIRGYLADGTTFDEAIAAWSRRYADVAERDHAALVAAVRSGRLDAEEGV
ncbi:DUF2252 domain-containing protein [Demequina rhizosphaerae]|uniref:DUF2252 domain-containing protein n=1 Tax=Demequina rhizosphaerae TaxID=1638985 RepID=UPI00078419CC|nr:DUF2252 domain-containing protein [Demequina rhizosphaerae]